MKKSHVILLLVLIGFMCFIIDPVYAGPGGMIAKGLFKTWWGKVLMLVLVLVLLPIIIYIKSVEYLKERKTKKQLTQISLKNRDFSWVHLEKIFSNIITRVYTAWANENMAEVKEYVNHWYWQNQQAIHLDQWKSNNLKNICNLQKINNIRPLYVELTNTNDYEGSKVAISFSGDIEDYLINKETQKVVKGKRGYQSETHIWIMEYSQGKWLLDDIRDGSLSLAFAKMENVIPKQQVVISK
ncbi:Tim44 domain-containing protein [Aquimarina sp. M1]